MMEDFIITDWGYALAWLLVEGGLNSTEAQSRLDKATDLEVQTWAAQLKISKFGKDA